MNDQEAQFLDAVRTVLQEAGFAPAAAGAEGVHVIQHARGAMVGWMPQEIQRLRARVRARRRGPRRTRTVNRNDLPGLRQAFGLALAAAFRNAGFTVEDRGDEWLLVINPAHRPEL
ncbi:hypothetical protein [Streptomyces sp. A1547]|uniref:hypothetical protein n=1 Tax=Streptomyces sp. A1547 TaxID=2563105 RepID=UPI00061F8B66|nr:hypothetical protein [Streptomyces sp. A1547]KJY28827.1 hypothetical protein VR46_37640 [Streptomyces sp. NRRL S-444]THA39864.1 hypothetical protein E6W17_09955 [Streptomyces sp. A1547]